jgi:hypothetical protein
VTERSDASAHLVVQTIVAYFGGFFDWEERRAKRIGVRHAETLRLTVKADKLTSDTFVLTNGDVKRLAFTFAVGTLRVGHFESALIVYLASVAQQRSCLTSADKTSGN